MKLIFPGYAKTGTKSVRKALEILGYENVHDICEQLVYDYDVINKWKSGRASIEDIKEAFKDVDTCIEFPTALMFRELLKAFPAADVVLTMRPADDWKRSLCNMIKVEKEISIFMKYPKLARLFFQNSLCPNIVNFITIRELVFSEGFGMSAYKLNSLCDEDYERARMKYIKHNQDVIKLCKGRKLLIFDVRDGWEPMCKFLDKEIPDEPFPMRNIKHSMVRGVIKTGGYEFDAGFNKAIIKEMIRIIALVFIFATFIAVLLFVTLYNTML